MVHFRLPYSSFRRTITVLRKKQVWTHIIQSFISRGVYYFPELSEKSKERPDFWNQFFSEEPHFCLEGIRMYLAMNNIKTFSLDKLHKNQQGTL